MTSVQFQNNTIFEYVLKYKILAIHRYVYLLLFTKSNMSNAQPNTEHCTYTLVQSWKKKEVTEKSEQ